MRGRGDKEGIGWNKKRLNKKKKDWIYIINILYIYSEIE